MFEIETDLKAFPLKTFAAGDYILTEGEKTECIYFLLEGSLEITKGGKTVSVLSDKGAVIGEVSIFLDTAHTASVQCLEQSWLYQIDNPKAYLEDHPKVIWAIAQKLSLKLFNLSQYLVDVKKQYEGHDHLGMIDEVLETIQSQQQNKVLRREPSKRDAPDY